MINKADITQLVESWLPKPDVAGSSPVVRSISGVFSVFFYFEKLVIILFAVIVFFSCSIGHGLGPEPSERPGISGKIIFTGEWPPSTSEIRIAVYKEYPPSSFLNINAFSDPLPLYVSETDYFVPLSPGGYGWVVVAWRSATQFWNPDNVLGYYKEDPESTEPSSVVVREKTSTNNIDIIADFNNLKSID